jgi:hypothetical protein
MKPVKKWSGSKPVKCDLCGYPFVGYFIDGRTFNGQWGLLCETCHSIHGMGLGLGRGQKYDLATLQKVDG